MATHQYPSFTLEHTQKYYNSSYQHEETDKEIPIAKHGLSVI